MEQTNNTTNFKKIHKTGFTVIGNDVTMDKSLSLKERGMILTLMSLPDSWKFSVVGLSGILPEATNTINRILNSLETKGYLKREMKKSQNGKILGCNYLFADYPLFLETTDLNNEELSDGLNEPLEDTTSQFMECNENNEKNEAVDAENSLSQKLRYGENMPYRKNDDVENGYKQNEAQYNKHKYNTQEYNKQDRLIDRLIDKLGYSDSEIEQIKNNQIYQAFQMDEIADSDELSFIESIGYLDFACVDHSDAVGQEYAELQAEEAYYCELLDIYESVVDEPNDVISFAKHENVSKQQILNKLRSLNVAIINQFFSEMTSKINTTSEIEISQFKSRLKNYLEKCIYNYRPSRRSKRAAAELYAH